jgi:hypothetical protein
LPSLRKTQRFTLESRIVALLLESRFAGRPAGCATRSLLALVNFMSSRDMPSAVLVPPGR